MIKQVIDKALFTGKEYHPFSSHWQEVFSKIEHPFHWRYPGQIADKQAYEKLQKSFSPELCQLIDSKTKSDPLNVFFIVLSGFCYLLSKYSRKSTVIINTPLLKTDDNEIYNDQVVICQEIPSEGTVRDYILQARDVVVKSYAYQNFPIEIIGAHVPIHQMTNIRFCHAGLHHDAHKETAFDIQFILNQDSQGYRLGVNYNTAVFNRGWLKNFLDNLEYVLWQYRQLDVGIHTLSYISDEEKALVTQAYQPACEKYLGAEKHPLQWLKEKSTLHPSGIAVEFGQVQVTYQELNEQSNQLARHIRENYGLKPGDRVGLMLERSERMMTGMLAIMKAGCVYVPIDPVYPTDQINFILEDAALHLLLIDSSHMFNIGGTDTPVFVLDYQLKTLTETKDEIEISFSESDRRATDIAYMIYTSGSTGRKKGVMVGHPSLQNLCAWYVDRYEINQNSKVLLLVPFGFDASIKNMLAPLMAGGTLVLPPAGKYDPEKIGQVIAKKKVTHINCVPSAFLPILYFAEKSAYEELSSLRWLAFGGEPLDIKPFSPWLNTSNCVCKITNVYGPTEGVDTNTVYEVTEEDIQHPERVPIGKPIPNCKVYIVDENLYPVPHGVTGEICLGGWGVAHGYWNLPDVTREKFVDNPFEEKRGKLYKTGDRARWRMDGCIDFLGREDDQVKIRGIRVEPGEIQSVIRQHPAVAEAHVYVKELNGEKTLATVVKPAKPTRHLFHQLAQLKTTRPKAFDQLYVLPNHWVVQQTPGVDLEDLYHETWEDLSFLQKKMYLEDEAVVVDMSADTGLFSLGVGLQWKHANIYAIASEGPLLDALQLNTSLYDIDVKTYGFDRLPYAEEGLEDKIPSLEREGQQIAALHEVTEKYQLNHIDLLKIVISGEQWDVIKNMVDDDGKPIHQLIITFRNGVHRVDELKQWLKSKGFTCEVNQNGKKSTTFYAFKKTKNQLTYPLIQYNKGDKWTSPQALIKDIKRYCADKAADYMIPETWKVVLEIPLMPNGKADAERLANIAGMEFPFEAYTSLKAPGNETEKKLAAIWEKVLEKDKIGVDQDFFELGGNSLKTVQLIAGIHKEFNIRLEFKTIFDHLTIERLAHLIATTDQTAYTAIQLVPLQAHYEVSHAQKRLWVLEQFGRGQTAYHMFGAYVLEDIHVDVFEKALTAIVQRHESLRTTFDTIEGEVRQIIHPEETFKQAFIQDDLRNFPDKENQAKKIAQQELAMPFDLKNGPLLRTRLLRLEDRKFVFIYSMHHIISDGWSMAVLINEMMAIYEAFLNGHPNPLPELTLQYKDFAAWQNQQLYGESIKKHQAYWWENFQGELPVLSLQTDYPRPAMKTFNGDYLDEVFDRHALEGLQQLSHQQGATLFMTLQALVKTLLYKYTAQEDIIVGTPVSGRSHPELENQIGFYINTLPLRTSFSGRQSFESLLQKVKMNTLAAFDHQVYPFDRLVDDLDLARDMSRNPVFDVMVILQNINEGGERAQVETQRSNGFDPEATVSKFDLSFAFKELRDGLLATIEYNTDLYAKERIRQMMGHLRELLTNILQNPQLPLKALSLLPQEEQESLLHINRHEAGYPRNKTIQALFEETVAQYPQHIALTFGNQHITYQALNERANQLSHLLKETMLIAPGDTVAIIMDRTDGVVTAILAALKAGAAYVPIDPAYPAERIHFILKDTSVKGILADRKNTLVKHNLLGWPHWIADDAAHITYPKENPVNVSNSEDPAYIIYTSGSTGKPKGVVVSHQNMVRLFVNEAFPFDFTFQDTWTLFHSVCFDFSVWEIFGALLFGGRLVVVSQEAAHDFKKLAALIREEKVTVLNLTPSAFRAFMTVVEDEKELASTLPDFMLRYIIFGGESLNPKMLKSWKALYPHTKLVNMYGITEITVHATYKEITEKEIDSGIGNIGRPIPTLNIYLMNGQYQLVPMGNIGEIMIGGAGITKGYLNQSELTSQRFIKNPYDPQEILYASGDLGVMLPDGEIVYAGRKDFQVKVRGYRVELGEIENAIRQQEGISHVICMPVKDPLETQQVVAYYSADREISVQALKSSLKKRLPDYMIPAHFIAVKDFPMTAHGKIDRKKLPPPASFSPENTHDVAPGNYVEITLAEILKALLGKEKVGITDNFFEIGGHSLKAVQYISRIYKSLHTQVELKDIFEHPTIQRLAKFIVHAEKRTYESIEPVSEKIYYDLSYAQRRLWILSRLGGNQSGYNIWGAYTFEGKVNFETLQKVIQALLERHEILRTSFVQVAGEPRQKILPMHSVSFKTDLADLRGVDDNEKQVKQLVETESLKGFDLENWPLFRVHLYQLGDEKYIFLFTMHHIISDGWSIEILVQEFIALYQAYRLQQPMPLAPLQIQYKDYAEWQSKQLQGEKLRAHRDYWKQQFSGAIPVLHFPTDFKRPSIKTTRGKMFSIQVDRPLADQLYRFSVEKEVSLFMTMLAAWKVLMYRYTAQEDMTIGTVEAGRNHPDLENQIGFYINTLALRTRFDGAHTFLALLKKVKSTVLGAYQHIAYPFDKLVDDLDIHWDRSRSPLFDVVFSLQNIDTDQGRPESKRLQDIQVGNYATNAAACIFDLIVSAIALQDTLTISFCYNTDIFRESTIMLLKNRYLQLLASVVEQPDMKINEIELSENGRGGDLTEDTNHEALDINFNFN